MTWLLRLYPRTWRRRYGAEVAAILRGRGFSLQVAIDLIAGAVDVWMHPRETLSVAVWSAPDAGEESTMSQNQREAMVAMFSATLALALLWIWVHIGRGDNPLVDVLSMALFILGPLVSLRYTWRKDRSAGVQAVTIGALTSIIAIVWIGLGLLATGL